MLNMIKLDWLGMKYYRMRIIILPFFVSLYGVLSELLIIPLIAFFMLSFSVNPFAVEEKGKLDNLYLTLPITRKTIVKTRFCLSLIMQAAGLLLGILLTVLLSTVLHGKNVFYMHTYVADFPSVSLLVCWSFLFYAIVNLAMFPTLFKIGYAKGKTIGFYLPVVGATVVMLVLYLLWNLNDGFHQWGITALQWAYTNPLAVSGIFLVLAAAVLGVSYLLSCRLYAKREL